MRERITCKHKQTYKTSPCVYTAGERKIRKDRLAFLHSTEEKKYIRTSLKYLSPRSVPGRFKSKMIDNSATFKILFAMSNARKEQPHRKANDENCLAERNKVTEYFTFHDNPLFGITQQL